MLTGTNTWKLNIISGQAGREKKQSRSKGNLMKFPAVKTNIVVINENTLRVSLDAGICKLLNISLVHKCITSSSQSQIER